MNDEDLLVLQDAALEGLIILPAPGCRFVARRGDGYSYINGRGHGDGYGWGYGIGYGDRNGRSRADGYGWGYGYGNGHGWFER